MDATRPWQHVLEPLSGYLVLGQAISNHSVEQGDCFNFGPQDLNEFSVRDVLERLSFSIDGKSIREFLTTPNIDRRMLESSLLKLNCDKARAMLDWSATLNLQQTIEFTCEWYQEYLDGKSSQDLLIKTNEQITQYTWRALESGASWTRCDRSREA